jgi:hypothetical protein
MDRTIKSAIRDVNLFKQNPGLLEYSIKAQRVELFKQLDIQDNQPVVLTFKSINTIDHPEYISDPLVAGEIKTTVNIEYPVTRHVVITKSINETYKEHISF